MEFGKRLKQARQKQKLTQATVAENLHVSRQTISSWETGNSYPDIDSLIALSNYYELSLDTLLKEDSGMADTLRKPVVLQQMRPIIKWLTVGYVIFMSTFIFSFSYHVTRALMLLMGLFSILALNKLQVFVQNLEPQKNQLTVWWPKYRLWWLLGTVASTGVTIYLWLTAYQRLANDFTVFTMALWFIIGALMLKVHEQRTL